MPNEMTNPIADYPGYRIVEKVPNYGPSDNVALPTFKAGDVIAIRPVGRDYWHSYKLGSVVSYAMELGVSPVAALGRAHEHGHKLHWATPMGASLSDTRPASKPVYYGVAFGDQIRFEGQVFRLEPAPNHNVELRTLGPAD